MTTAKIFFHELSTFIQEKVLKSEISYEEKMCGYRAPSWCRNHKAFHISWQMCRRLNTPGIIKKPEDCGDCIHRNRKVN